VLMRQSFSNVALNNINTREGADNLFHLGLNTHRDDLPGMFGDVKFFLTGGAAARMRDLAHKLAFALPEEMLKTSNAGYRKRFASIGGAEETRCSLHGVLGPIASTERFEMYKVGPVLLCNHGMGIPSTAIMLHEIAKLLHYAGADDPAFIRLGTSGGIGAPPGTVVVTTEGVNGMLEPSYTLPILGKLVSRPTTLHRGLSEAILSANASAPWMMQGRTMSTDCFYEGPTCYLLPSGFTYPF
jgi:uridine phosphorylase